MFPQHKYAEQSVLGLCVNEPEISHKVTKLNNDLFYEPKTKRFTLRLGNASWKATGLTHLQL